MMNVQDIAQRYIDSWNEADATARRQLLDRLWTEDAHYVDPMMRADGRDGIAAVIGGVHARFPGHTFALTGAPDGHGRFLRFSWSLGPSGGAPIARGTDFAELAEDGRLATVTGFLDQVPAAA